MQNTLTSNSDNQAKYTLDPARLSLVFAILFAFFILTPAFLNIQTGWVPFFQFSDLLDLFTPLVLIPLYGLLFWNTIHAPSRGKITLFLICVALWVQGQGMHLAANAIGHAFKFTNLESSEAYPLVYFFDEQLGHYIWHLGIVGLIALILWQQWQDALVILSPNFLIVCIAALIYGVTTFVTTIEAGTVPLGLSFAVIVSLFALTRGRIALRTKPIFAFFSYAQLLALVLLIGYGLYFRGFPEFSDLGLI